MTLGLILAVNRLYGRGTAVPSFVAAGSGDCSELLFRRS